MHRSRVVRKIVQTVTPSATPTVSSLRLIPLNSSNTCQCFSRQAEIRADTNRGERVRTLCSPSSGDSKRPKTSFLRLTANRV